MTSYPAFCDHILHQNELVAAGICHGDTWNLIFINNMLGEILKLSPGRMDDEPFLPRLTRCGFDEVEESLSEPHGGELIAHHKEGSMYIIRWKSVSIDDSAGGEQVRLITMSKIPVDPAPLAGYIAFFQEEFEASLRLDPGVLAVYAVAA